jgi:two-component system, cell cycle sensor histidine kinase and response regulator CckA
VPADDRDRLQQALLAIGAALYDLDLARGTLWRDEAHPLFAACLAESAKTGAALTRWAAQVDPEDRSRVLDDLARAFRERAPRWSSEYRVRLADGSHAFVWDRGIVTYDAAGNAVRLVGTIFDITEPARTLRALEASEERYRALVSAASQAVWVHDTTTDTAATEESSRWWTDITGQGSADQGGWSWLDMVHPDDREEVRQTWTHCRTTGERYDIEYRIAVMEGGYRHFHVTGLPIRRPDGSIREWVGMFVDITDRRLAEEALRQAHKMEAVGQLAGGIAHDFNNVLTIIQGYSELALSELEPGHPLADSIVEIRKASTRAADLTRQLLAFSRKAVIRPVLLDLNAIIGEAENMLRRLIGEHIELATTLDPALWRVKADPVQIDQILLNLAANARDAMPRGGRLTIATRNVDAEGKFVELRVSDTGCGMDAETKTKIFEPFFSTKGPDKGTGMGLAAVYGIVQQCGGRIEVDSAPGRGATFAIHVPACFEQDKANEGALGTTNAPRGRETVILVEDDPSVRSLARDVLARQGYVVLEAEDGPAALAVSANHSGQIHLVLTDVVMPGMSGLEVVQALRRSRPQVKALLVSGYMDDALGAHGALETEIELLLKPFTPAALAKKVRDVLDR